MRILVTGASGFVGKYLVKALLENGHKVSAIVQENNDFLEVNKVKTYKINILDYESLVNCFKVEQPDAVMHLAAISNIPVSWNNPGVTADVNIRGTINVLQALISIGSKAKFINVGSSDEYGLAAKIGTELTEDILCQPQNPYAISKYCAEQMVLQLGKKAAINVIHVRPFNHFGPGQAKEFVTSDFACQIANIEKGKQEPVLYVGNLSAFRDFLFIADVIGAYVKIIENNIETGIYNICSGKARKIEDILMTLVKLSKVKITIKQDPSKMRPSEVPYFVGNCDKLKKAIDWQANYDFEDGVKEVLEYWRQN